MLAFLTRRKVTALIWQYLDGVIPSDRFDLLQRVLRSNRWVRQQFVDCAVLNALLFAYFNPGRYSAVPARSGRVQEIDDFECEACNLDLDAELEAIEREEREREQRETRERRTKRPAG